MDEDSIFDGHRFVTLGKDITTIDIDLPLVKIDKNSVIVKWIGKLELHNDGVYGMTIDVKSMTANSDEEKSSEVQSGPLNFNGFDFVIRKTKNGDIPDVQVFIESIYVATQERKIYVEFII